MKVALANLGGLTFALKASLETLDIEAVIPSPNNQSMFLLSQEYMPSELCYPLKILLGNYLSVKDSFADAVIFYSGCDMCNLAPINYMFNDVFNELNWYPATYHCEINSKKAFILSYINALKGISNKPWYRIATSISAGIKVFDAHNFLDQVFYNVRPFIPSHAEAERLYNNYLQEITNFENSAKIAQINNELFELYNEYASKDHSNVIKIGLVGDTYSLTEPFTHQYLDKKLGNMNVILDRWSDHKLIPKHLRKIQDAPNPKGAAIKRILKQKYGVLTALEITKLSRYVSRGYDGIIFVSPMTCNPNDALRNILMKVQSETDTPLLSLIFDEHTCSTGLDARLEAFVDCLVRRKVHQDCHVVNY